MLQGKRVVCVIPARLGSTRFPRKVLHPLQGKPLVVWALDAARSVSLFDEVVCAVDAVEVADCIQQHGGRAIMTEEGCASGTDRLIELHRKGDVTGDIWVNWQADEPFINEEMIASLLQSCGEPHEHIWTLKKHIEDPQEIASSHVVKVVCDASGRALYFSRSPIPYSREHVLGVHYKHIGLYAYSTGALALLAHLPACPLEQIEKLEQLRFLYHGLHIQVHETQHETLGIDIPEHLTLAACRL